MHSLIIFASGRGSNARAIIDHFSNNNDITIALIVSNNPEAGVLQIAGENDIPSLVAGTKEMKEQAFIELLLSYHPSLIVLAGFMKKIPELMVHSFKDKIINIHPALLPGYGGKGMYGMNVHQAVISNAEKRSGITIHYVNEHYDEGNIILQAGCDIATGETAETLANKIHFLEHFYYPRCIEFLLK